MRSEESRFVSCCYVTDVQNGTLYADEDCGIYWRRSIGLLYSISGAWGGIFCWFCGAGKNLQHLRFVSWEETGIHVGHRRAKTPHSGMQLIYSNIWEPMTKGHKSTEHLVNGNRCDGNAFGFCFRQNAPQCNVAKCGPIFITVELCMAFPFHDTIISI